MTETPEHERPIEDRIRESIAVKAAMLAGQTPEKPKKARKKS